MDLPVEPLDEFSEARRRARAHMEQIDREVKERDRERREGRVQGKLSHSLVEKVGNCNPKQLKRLIKLVRQHLKDHRRPPELWEIRLYYNSKVVAHASHRNKLYCLEQHSCGKANCRKCPHGEYIYSYQRDGQFYPRSKTALNFSRLPKPVRDYLGPIREGLKKRREPLLLVSNE